MGFGMRFDKPRYFRQSMSWVHTWTGLVMGWLLFAVYVTGALSYFRNEITVWMQPELHAAAADEEWLPKAVGLSLKRWPMPSYGRSSARSTESGRHARVYRNQLKEMRRRADAAPKARE
jgi:hypothetical protein